MSIQMMRDRYLGDNVTTASPAKLVTMLYDRLLRDLTQAEAGLASNDLAAVNEQLVHAQEIVWELTAGLDPTKWAGGPALASLYQFLLDELIAANVGKNAELIVACRILVAPLRDAWHQAAAEVASSPARVAVSA